MPRWLEKRVDGVFVQRDRVRSSTREHAAIFSFPAVLVICMRRPRSRGRAARSLVATKIYLPTPSVEVSTREVKRVAKLDEHIG